MTRCSSSTCATAAPEPDTYLPVVKALPVPSWDMPHVMSGVTCFYTFLKRACKEVMGCRCWKGVHGLPYDAVLIKLSVRLHCRLPLVCKTCSLKPAVL